MLVNLLSDTRTAIVRNATVWTSGPKGKLANASVLVENGKIVAVMEKGVLVGEEVPA